MFTDYRLSGGGKCRGGALLKLIVFLIILGGVLTAAWILFLPAILTSTLQKRTGFDVKVKRLIYNPFTSRVEMDGLVVSNPLGFPRGDFITVESFYADMDIQSILDKRPVINYMKIHVSNLGLVRNSQGTLNAKLFYDRLVEDRSVDKDDGKRKDSDKKSDSTKDKDKRKEPEKAPAPVHMGQYLITELEVKFDHCVVLDYAKRPPMSKEYNLNISQKYEGVITTKQLLQPLAMKSLSSVGSAIEGLIPGSLGRAVGQMTQPGSDIFAQNPKKAGDPLQNLIDALEESQKQ